MVVPDSGSIHFNNELITNKWIPKPDWLYATDWPLSGKYDDCECYRHDERYQKKEVIKRLTRNS